MKIKTRFSTCLALILILSVGVLSPNESLFSATKSDTKTETKSDNKTVTNNKTEDKSKNTDTKSGKKTEKKNTKPDSYKIRINKQANTVTVYKQNSDGKFKPYKAFVCSTGYATPLGNYSIKSKMRWHTLKGPCYGQYCSRIVNGVLFHSVWYNSASPSDLSYSSFNKLGTTASHGCVRLCVRDAKWIYDKCPIGTPIYIYNAKKAGPLGKPKAIKVSGIRGYDPTDIWSSANPYNKKKPKIKGAKNKTIKFGDKTYKTMKGITARNTTGFDAKKLVETRIKYRTDKKSEYKDVKKVNVKKPGIYKVTYYLKDEIDRVAQKTVTHKVLTGIAVSSIKLNKNKKTLYLGSTVDKSSFKLKVDGVSPKNASVRDVTFKSSKTSVVSVDSEGNVTAKKGGEATITVSAADGSGVTNVCTITVKQLITRLLVTNPDLTSLNVGNKIKLKVATDPLSATCKKFKFISSNESVAKVSSSGTISCLKTGSAVIGVKAQDGSGISTSVTIKIKAANAGATSSPSPASTSAPKQSQIPYATATAPVATSKP